MTEGDKSGLLEQLRIDRTQRDQPVGRHGRLRIVLLVLLVCALLAALAGYLLLRGQRIEVDAVSAQAPAAQGATSVLQATGYVTARREATVSAQITGTLAEVLIEEGEQVKQGQVLARLDDTAQKAALAQAQAQFRAATALRAQDQVQLEQARRDLVRNQELVDADAVSRQAAEQAQTQVDALAAEVIAQERQQELAQAGIQAADVQLSYTVIR
ncbi:MAG TPA: biotin/lipoyl-binding protein, partial [Steroidobacteraceae bacterium]